MTNHRAINPPNRQDSQTNHEPEQNTPPQEKQPKPSSAKKSPRQPKPANWKQLLGELPLQTETTTFILINVLDIFLTYLLLTLGASEVNPLANYFFQHFDFVGMIVFKLVIVAVVCLIAQVVALYKPRSAKFLLIFGNVMVGAVVLYSLNLLRKIVF